MSFEPDEDQQELVALVRGILSQRADSAASRRAMESAERFDVDLWRLLCEEIGIAGMAIPEEFGGAGFTLREAQLVLEEIGYSLAPSPYLGSVAIAAQAILATGDADAVARLLPGIAEGSSSAALAWADPTGRFAPDRVDVQAEERDGWTLNGACGFVLDGDAAEVLLVIARTPEGPRLFEVLDADTVVREETPAMDQTLRMVTLRFDETPARTLGAADAEVLETVRALALTAVSAVQAGTAARALDDTVAYATQRVQFGRAIGSFQALKHRMADMHVRVEVARTASRAASAALASRAADRFELAAIAKATCSEALAHVAAEMIQLHGGIAITWEHDAHLIFKRAHALGQLFGTARELRERAEIWALAHG
ncbi:acyl-CoA dehydrogenase family protein [Microbacterium paraoxydans]|uniref:acyl-CoA dehydrogenase family protein n=1 Tax=Microbacterium paraoxydans TaxID=199592 RepID=UPI001CFB1BEE|nr:acyl-CoA dehydrogenase family protein [Microbacterium paraoxydans]